MSHAVAKIPVVGPSIAKPIKDVGTFIQDPSLGSLSKIGRDLIPAAVNYFGGPLAAGAYSAAKTLDSGDGIGDALKSGAKSAAGAYAANTLGSAFTGGGQPAVDPSLPWAPEPSIFSKIGTGLDNATGNVFSGVGNAVGDAASSIGSNISSTIASLANNLGISPDTMNNLFSSNSMTSGGGPESFSGTGPMPEVSVSSYGGTGDGGSIFASAPVDSYGDLSALDFTDPESLAGTFGSNVGSGTVGTAGLTESPNFSSLFSEAAGAAPGAAAGGGYYDTGGSLASAASTAAKAADPSLWSKLTSDPLGTIGKGIMDHPMAALSAAGLGISALKGSNPVAGETAFNEIASGQSQQGKEMQDMGMKALETGQLPPGMAASINQATEAAKATIRSQYAARGMSGSSSEQQDLAAVDARAQAQSTATALQLIDTGINETGMAANLYRQIMGQNLQNDQDLSSAIAQFAASLAGGAGKQAG